MNRGMWMILALAASCGSASEAVVVEEAIEVSELKEQCLTEAVVINGLSAPESAHYDSGTRSWYVSTRAGTASQPLGQGWVARVSRDGKQVETQWASGFVSPTGVTGDTRNLYVVDGDRVRVVNLRTAKVVEEIVIPSALFLNDIARSSDGTLYVSDTFGQTIYSIGVDRQPRAMLVDASLQSPNGLAVDGDTLIIASIGSLVEMTQTAPIFRYHLKEGTLRAIDALQGKWDGVVLFDEGLALTDFRGQLVLTEEDRVEQTLEVAQQFGLSSTADLGLDKRCKTVAIPDLFAEQLVLLPLKDKL